MLGPQCTKVIATKWLEIAPIQHLVLQEVGASTAKDLPHWVFMLILVLLFGGGGLVYSMSSCSEFLVQSISRQIMSNHVKYLNALCLEVREIQQNEDARR